MAVYVDEYLVSDSNFISVGVNLFNLTPLLRQDRSIFCMLSTLYCSCCLFSVAISRSRPPVASSSCSSFFACARSLCVCSSYVYIPVYLFLSTLMFFHFSANVIPGRGPENIRISFSSKNGAGIKIHHPNPMLPSLIRDRFLN